MSDVSLDTALGGSGVLTSALSHPTRPFYWSVRRELWENRATYLAPANVAGVLMVGSLLAALRFGRYHDDVSQIDPAQRLGLMELPYGVAALAIVVTMFIVAVFYCLGALHNERRDRSILFWKSLPVSDLTAVLSKAAIPLVVMPIVAFVVIEALQLAMLFLNTVTILVRGQNLSQLWGRLPWLQMQGVVLYTLAVTALWFAPIYAWLLFISGWAKRAPFLWAFLPPLALSLVEKIAFNTSYIGDLISYRLHGFKDAFSEGTVSRAGRLDIVTSPISLLDPLGLLSLPGLWSGLMVAAGLLAAAVWFRRRQEPI